MSYFLVGMLWIHGVSGTGVKSLQDGAGDTATLQLFKKRHAAPSNILFRSPTLTCSASDWLASVSPVCTLRYRLYLAVSSRSAAPGVVWWKNPAFPGFSAFIFMDVGRVLWWRNLNVFITRHSVITCREDVFTAAALTYSSCVEMYIQAEPGRVEPVRVWRSSERIVP